MAAERAKSADASPRRDRRGGLRRREPICTETLTQLRASSPDLHASRRVENFVRDCRGNAMSVNTHGHIHHPLNLTTAWKWLAFADALLQSRSTGTRQRLQGSIESSKRVVTTEDEMPSSVITKSGACIRTTAADLRAKFRLRDEERKLQIKELGVHSDNRSGVYPTRQHCLQLATSVLENQVSAFPEPSTRSYQCSICGQDRPTSAGRIRVWVKDLRAHKSVCITCAHTHWKSINQWTRQGYWEALDKQTPQLEDSDSLLDHNATTNAEAGGDMI